MPRRIIPVSSGKGGVGKTTVAINFALALSRYAPTVLVDLDTGTSSVRNTLGVPVERDLYHFFKKGYRLDDCVTRLPDAWDRDGRYRDFGFVAGPLHLIEEITNFGATKKAQLSAAINALPTTWVVLDMKAGLDSNVIDFLPYSNSGLLVFTPHLPSATLAASDIVKAILFRKLRIVFSPGSPFYARVDDPRTTTCLINDLLDRVEDVYDPALPNLDAFLADLMASLGQHPALEQIAKTVEFFRVYYVLNAFNGVREAFETAVKPFVENLVTNVSERLQLTHLGWVVRSEAVHRSNCERRPFLLTPTGDLAAPRPGSVDALLDAAGLLSDKRRHRPVFPTAKKPDPDRALEAQLDALQRMYQGGDHSATDPRANIDYLTSRAVHILVHARSSELGTPKICGREEILQAFFPKDEPPAAPPG